MIIGGRFNSYGRTAVTEELLSAGLKHRNLLECERIEEYFRILEPVSRFARWRRYSAAGE
jgi:hypothetical protein